MPPVGIGLLRVSPKLSISSRTWRESRWQAIDQGFLYYSFWKSSANLFYVYPYNHHQLCWQLCGLGDA
ncbi:hypothetical protein E2C01_061263 [Portunus trituberculatus]|uniref:Uncharacterized protein n=1 Tax=Portunus trituberculatus TaxID=210409 RepID=A0A5B7HDW9_PORTR|nr:hypothetical protein [Portunus trituberculatus]